MLISIKENSLSLSVLIIPPLTILTSALIGKFYFGEPLVYIQIAGSVFIFIGILFILFGPIMWK